MCPVFHRSSNKCGKLVLAMPGVGLLISKVSIQATKATLECSIWTNPPKPGLFPQFATNSTSIIETAGMGSSVAISIAAVSVEVLIPPQNERQGTNWLTPTEWQKQLHIHSLVRILMLIDVPLFLFHFPIAI